MLQRLHRMKSSAVITAFVTLVLAAAASAATLELRDGRRLDGDVRMDGARFLLKRDGKEEALDLDQVTSAALRPEPKPEPSKPAPPPAKKLDPPKPDAARGLRAEYFGDGDLKRPVAVRLDPMINFVFSDEQVPDPALPKEFSVRWTGALEPPASGNYKLRFEVNDAARLWVGGKPVVDRWAKHAETHKVEVPLKRGQRVEVRAEFRRSHTWGIARLYWENDRGLGREVVPAKQWTPPPRTVAPAVVVASPSPQSLHLDPRSIQLTADAADDGEVREVEFFVDNAPVGKSTTRPWRVEWRDPSAGHHRVKARATDADGVSTLSPSVPIAVARGEGLERLWAQMTVGQDAQLGRARSAGQSHTIKADGGSLVGERGPDVFHAVVRPLPGDGALVARFDSLTATGNAPAAAGLFIREHLNAGPARAVFLGMLNESGLAFVHREHVWAPRNATEDAAATPVWLKLVRHGKSVTAHRSDDGKAWRAIGEKKFDVPPDAFAGLAIAGGGEPAGATFSHLALVGGPPRFESTVKGVLLRSGTTLVADVHAMDGTTLKVGRPDREIAIPRTEVARLLFRPLTNEVLERVGPGRTGAVLPTGDFVDGPVAAVAGGQLTVDSVLFGRRKLNTHDGLIAALLRDAAPVAAAVEVKLVDGGVVRARSIAVEKGRLVVTEVSDPVFTFGAQEIAGFRRRP